MEEHRMFVRLFTFLAILASFWLPSGFSGPSLAQGASPTSGTTRQCFLPIADTYAHSYQPTTNFGGETTLQVAAIGDVEVDRRWSFLKFDLSPIPSGAVVVSADLNLYLTSTPYGGSGALKAAQVAWAEYGLTWNNSPPVSDYTYDEISWAPGATGWRTWSAEQLVQQWVNITGPSLVNNGLALVAYGIATPPSSFHSREGRIDRQPRLCVEWSSSLTTDIVIGEIEVTQAVQDLQNSVRLVAGKPTYVRVHATTTNGNFRTFATLRVSNVSGTVTLHPQNPGAHVVVRPAPDREIVDHSFLFLLPHAFTQAGGLALTAEVNPLVSGWRTSRYPAETSYANNSRSAGVIFEEAPRVGVIMVLGSYSLEDNGSSIMYTTPITDAYQTRSWLGRAFPLPEIWMTVRTHDFGAATVQEDKKTRLATPNSGSVNRWLDQKRAWDLSEQSWYEDNVGDESDIRYYAMLTNSGAFMRGAMGSRTGSGPTGAIGGWDLDGIFGDWYAGHEIAHSFGRKHVQGDLGGKEGTCGGEEGVDANYPHESGFISSDSAGVTAFFGFDSGTGAARPYGLIPLNLQVYGPHWRDVLTYCSPQWVSEYTTEGILDYVQSHVTPLGVRTAADTESAQQIDRLLVVGTIDPTTGDTELAPLFVIPNAPNVEPRIPGPYAIVLRGAGGSELARYPFTPEELHSGPDDPNGSSGPPIDLLSISELVPYVAGTVQVDVTGPWGTLATVTAGANAPAVTVTSPSAGQISDGDTLPVAWSASDVDGDPLVFNVQFSADGGSTWEMLAQGITGNSVAIPRANVASTTQGRVRVWVSDGIHTSSAESGGFFTTALRNPQVTLLSPSSRAIVGANQTLSLEALAYSPNVGTLNRDQVVWSSSIDGALGSGETLGVTGLTSGVHSFTVTVNDGKGSASATVTDVLVVSDPSLLPTPPVNLRVAPTPLVFWPREGVSSHTLTVDNEGGTNSINWGALEFTPWLSVSPTTGSTPGQATVSVNGTGMAPGNYTANILFGTSASTQNRTVQVTMVIPERQEPTSCQARSAFDANSEGWLVSTAAGDQIARSAYNATGGNGGGYISAANGLVSDPWYWEAPGRYLGDQSCAYGEALTFDLKQSSTGGEFNAADVILVGPSVTLVYDMPQNPGTVWTPFSVPLTADSGWVKHGTSTAPTEAEMLAVLSGLQALRIRGQYRTGVDIGSLDNVNLAATGVNIFLPLVVGR
jgi:hypothetical protein